MEFENRRFVHFPHPGGEHTPDDRRLEAVESNYPTSRAQVSASERRLIGL